MTNKKKPRTLEWLGTKGEILGTRPKYQLWINDHFHSYEKTIRNCVVVFRNHAKARFMRNPQTSKDMSFGSDSFNRYHGLTHGSRPKNDRAKRSEKRYREAEKQMRAEDRRHSPRRPRAKKHGFPC